MLVILTNKSAGHKSRTIFRWIVWRWKSPWLVESAGQFAADFFAAGKRLIALVSERRAKLLRFGRAVWLVSANSVRLPYLTRVRYYDR